MRAAKVDSNQAEIVRAFRQLGYSVCHLHTLGRGVPDLLVGINGKNWLIEVKAERGKLTADERNFFKTWKGQCIVLRTTDDVVWFHQQWGMNA